MASANHSNRTVAEMAQIAWVIENAELGQRIQGGREFKDTLTQLIPDLDVSSRSHTDHGMSVHGHPLAVLVDGVRPDFSRIDNRQLDSIDPFSIDHIEVVSGATSLYGDGSTSDLINIATEEDQPGTMMEFETDTKSGFSGSKDHGEHIVGAVPGGNEHISGHLSMAYRKFGGWFDGNGDTASLDNTQTGPQYSNRLDIIGAGALNIDESRQLQLTTQYYKGQGDDDYGPNLEKGFSAIRGTNTPSVNNGLNFDRVLSTERHLISL